MAERRSLTVGGRPVHERLAEGLPELTGAVLATVLEHVPVYGGLPAEELTGEIAPVTRRILDVIVDVLRDREVPEPAELDWLAGSVARRAEEGVPLAAVLDAYCVGGQEAWRRIGAAAGPDDVADLRATADLLIGYLRVMLAVVTEAYVAELRSMQSQEQGARQTLLAALLAGEPAAAAADRSGLRLPPEYVVLALRIGPHPDEQDGAAERVATVTAAVAARRKVRRMLAELERFGTGPALAQLDPGGGLVLLPSPRSLDDRWPDVRALVERAASAAGAELTAGVAGGAPGEVPASVARAREVLDVARRTGRPPGAYRLADVLLDYQLSRGTPATPALAALLDPLAINADLLPTLELHLANELNRRRTARMLHIHPNTLDYRLRRVTALTGLDPGRPSHLPVLFAALAARRALS
ncbi:Sugar diacid utilization regulator [Amycolatopsis arida]|uniref:Sugar diacid utilization regulator n=1 Tax=Amycolatopsis arida TaxID=587909 RepID=A0A1I6A7H2_9PSEU|nr:helix-turn-helix domain-containing protein [Amycolatopsis arida]TDX88553.1 sugar diacid utilization regulator [Amycolatopsis arida]SFQ64583.1 Sugar diacid utilization regulator [Amycolatopsis arida]